jgi:hypothetical protein
MPGGSWRKCAIDTAFSYGCRSTLIDSVVRQTSRPSSFLMRRPGMWFQYFLRPCSSWWLRGSMPSGRRNVVSSSSMSGVMMSAGSCMCCESSTSIELPAVLRVFTKMKL